jgi:hypothetical protein
MSLAIPRYTTLSVDTREAMVEVLVGPARQ